MPSFRSSTTAALRQRIVSGENGSTKGKPLRKANGMPFMLPFSPDTIRWRRAAVVELRKLGIDP